MFTRYLSERVIISQRTFHIHNTSLDLVQSEWISASCMSHRLPIAIVRGRKHRVDHWRDTVAHKNIRFGIGAILSSIAAGLSLFFFLVLLLLVCLTTVLFSNSNSIILFASLSLSLLHSQPISQVFTSPPTPPKHAECWIPPIIIANALLLFYGAKGFAPRILRPVNIIHLVTNNCSGRITVFSSSLDAWPCHQLSSPPDPIRLSTINFVNVIKSRRRPYSPINGSACRLF